MISGKDLYTVLSAVVPLYVAMIVAYGSVRWWKIFTPQQCLGVNRFVAMFAVPLLSFHVISSNDPYKMDFPFILADTLSKLAVFFILLAWVLFSTMGSLDWMITIFSLATLPNTLIMGIPLLGAMYGRFYSGLMVQLVVMQCIVWYTLMLFLLEYRGARQLLGDGKFPHDHGASSIASIRVNREVVSLEYSQTPPLQMQAEVDGDGKLHVSIRKSTSSTSPCNSLQQAALYSSPSPHNANANNMIRSPLISSPRSSNLTVGDNTTSLHSSNTNTPRRNKMPRQQPPPLFPESVSSLHSLQVPTPRTSNANENNSRVDLKGLAPYSPRLPPPPPFGQKINGGANAGGRINSPKAVEICKKISDSGTYPKSEDDGKELHMFVWSSADSSTSEGGVHVFGGSDHGPVNEPSEVCMLVMPSSHDQITNKEVKETMPVSTPFIEEKLIFASKSRCESPIENFEETKMINSTLIQSPKDLSSGTSKEQPPATVMFKLILQMVGRKLLHNPNTYSSLIGLIWALIAFRWNIVMPKIISNSIKLLSDAGLGMAMFSLGLFMALQPKLIACGTSLAILAMSVRFLTGPAFMAGASLAVGLRGTHLHAAIVQAALPQGIVPFVFAREYNLHPDILSTAVIFGMLISLPITLFYYLLLGL